MDLELLAGRDGGGLAAFVLVGGVLGRLGDLGCVIVFGVVLADRLGRAVPVPGGLAFISETGRLGKRYGAYQGSRTDQLRNTAAKTSRVTSVSTALPLWKNTPATAGTSASASGADCQCDSDSSSRNPVSAPCATRGRNRSSVDERMELRASDTVSDRVELRRDRSASGVAAGRRRKLIFEHGPRSAVGEESRDLTRGTWWRRGRGVVRMEGINQ